MFGLLGSRRTTPTTILGTHVGRLVDTVTHSGYDVGVFSDASRHQATVSFTCDSATAPVTEQTWRSWEDRIAGLDQLVASFTVDTVGPQTAETVAGPRAGGVFQATSKHTRKDNADLIAELMAGGQATQLFSHADALELDAQPLAGDRLTSILQAGLAVDEQTALADAPVTEHDGHLTLATDEITTLFTLALTPGVNDQLYDEMTLRLEEILAEWPERFPEITLRRTRLFRPYIDLSDQPAAPQLSSTGRRWQLLSVSGGELGVSALRDQFSALVDLRITRGWLRQPVFLLEALGTGVLGFQRTDEIKVPDSPTLAAEKQGGTNR